MFHDLFHFTAQDLDVAVRLIMATFLGGIIGLERERHGKDAGFRTYSLVCVGSALIMVVSTEIYEIYKTTADVDPSRIAAQVVSGIGFLGAGAIIRFPQGVRGLTTAAGIFAAAGIGLACGIAQYKPAIMTTLLTLIILIVFSRINRWMEQKDIRKPEREI
ncbi:MAG: MgtC/SapB family protein [Candidatus Omnitrophica bacterium]|nr:MgtC/SapB family protein [Candidatus Omnitrophota bacterium]